MKSSQPSTTAHKRNRPIDQKRLAKRTMRYAVDYMDHAPVWQAPIFARGLFRPTQNGAPAQPLEVHFTSKIQGSQMHYVARSPQALNVPDQAVYFHLCQLMAQSKHLLVPAHENYAAFKKALGLSGMWANSPLPVVRVQPADLAAGIGLTRTGTNAKAMLASLARLSCTTLQRRKFGAGSVAEEGHSRFLGLLNFDTEVWVVLNLESGLHAHQHKGVAWVNMREHRSLASKPAKRLHAWMTAWASPWERKLVALDKLLVSVWGEPPATPAIRKDRMRTLRKAIQEVGQLAGWSCALSEDGRHLLVRKPLFAGTAAQAEHSTPSPAAKEDLTAAVPAAATPTKAAATPTETAATATPVAATPTADTLEAAPSLDSDELVFSL